MTQNFQEDLQEVYTKTLKFAVDLASSKSRFTNTQMNQNDLKFIKKIEKEYIDFKRLRDHYTKIPKAPTPSLTPEIISPIKRKTSTFLPRDSGKQKLYSSLQERKNFVSSSRAGKLSVYPESGPGILERIKLNSSTNLEDSLRVSLSEKPKSLPHVSITTGKLKKSLELPSFKDYINHEKTKNSKDVTFEKLRKCDKRLEKFSKELDGLEIFVKSNPGVRWNSDKSVLIRLHDYPKQKALIIKAYNDQFELPSARYIRKRIVHVDKRKKNKVKEFLSKTPNPGQGNDYHFLKYKKKDADPTAIVERCYNRFQDAREVQNKNLISILESLNLGRAIGMRNKEQFILNDKEKFRDRGYSLRKMNEIKKKIDAEQSFRIRRSKKQAILYDLLMEFLKKKKKSIGICEAEVNFVEIIKGVLEEGWFLDTGIIEKILENFEDDDLNDLKEILEFLYWELDKLEN